MIFALIVVTFTVAFLTLAISDPCTPVGESIKASSGHISSLNFPDNFNASSTCTWNITVSSGKIIKLTFLNFTLVENENTNCSGAAATSARVFITNVASHRGDPNDFKLCGQKLPHPVYSEENFIQVRFEFRNGTVNKGFNASFEAIDGDSLCPTDMILNETSESLSSPFYPRSYPFNQTCSWNITVPSGKIVKLTFFNFTLVANENTDCSGAAATSARVLITNVASHGGDPNDFKLCGQKLPFPVYSEGNIIQVRFESRTDTVNKGFNASFEAIDGDSLCPTDMILNETSGSLSSPFYPRNYPFNQTCSWKIIAKQGHYIELTIPDYNLHQCDAVCSCDYLEVQNSFSNDSQAGKLCGTPRKTNLKFYSLHESLRVVFVSDDTKMDYDGFRATYTLLNYSPPSCPKEAIPLSGSGKISSTNYPKSNYTASRNCTWNITAPANKKVKLLFTDFVLSECSAKPCSDYCSFVELYDGGSTSSPSLGRFCENSSWNKPQFSTGNQMFVMFHPGKTVARGFEAEFSVPSSATTTSPPSSTKTKPTNESTATTETTTKSRRYQATGAPTESLSAGAAVGIALGCLAFLLLCFVVGYSCHRHVKKNKRSISPSREGTEMEKAPEKITTDPHLTPEHA